jgi:hydroxybutyrate-dimer hydrolase
MPALVPPMNEIQETRMTFSFPLARTGLALAALAALAACGSDTEVTIGSGDYEVNTRPFTLPNRIVTTAYDGVANDLLTAGLGRTGLASAVAPVLSATPTAAELRRLAIHTNYRALVDTTAGGGFGALYGPNVAADGTAGTGEGRIAGVEYLTLDISGNTVMLQVPSTFNPAAACLVTAPSSGSRGVYGAIGTSGEWGLKRGCAVVYTDKGTGNGVHDLQNDTVNRFDGTRATAAVAGGDSNFTVALSASGLAAFNAATPNRFAVKHAHSMVNPEAAWARDMSQSLQFALYQLNEQFGEVLPDGRRKVTLTPANILIIAAGVSNGGGAALALQELGNIADGVVVSEPNVQMAPVSGLRIERGTLPAYTGGSKPLYDYFSYANLLQPCAALATAAAGSPFGYTGGTAFVAGNRCASLAANGLVTGATTLEQANDALARLRAYGWEPDADLLHASHYLFASPAIAVTYANAHGRFSVTDNTCGFSFGAVDATGAPVAAAPAAIAGVFGTGNGLPPSGALQLIWNNSVGGPRNHGAATSPSTNALDFAFDGALCLRNLWTGTGAEADAVRTGVAEVRRSANLRGTPTIIVHGRNDTLVPPNFSSRPYVLRNAQVEGAASRVRYVEVTNAQHFDSFLPFPGYDTRFIPLHVYFNRAMDAMWAHLKNGAALPPSQVVRTTPRGGTPGAATAIAASNVPAIAANPPAGDRITIDGSTLRIPE